MTTKILAFAALLFAACTSQPAKQSATPIQYGSEIALTKPDTVGGLTINEALWLRTSSREYSAEPLSLEEVSGVLWAAAGINRPAENRLTAPSALALYPIRVYAFFAQGVYRYDAGAQKLVRVVEGDYRRLSGAQPFVAKAPMNLVYVADLTVYEGRKIPTEHVRYLCGQDAAGYAENVNLYAAGHGLKSITRGSFSPQLLPTLQLDTARYICALAQTVGK